MKWEISIYLFPIPPCLKFHSQFMYTDAASNRYFGHELLHKRVPECKWESSSGYESVLLLQRHDHVINLLHGGTIPAISD